VYVRKTVGGGPRGRVGYEEDEEEEEEEKKVL